MCFRSKESVHQWPLDLGGTALDLHSCMLYMKEEYGSTPRISLKGANGRWRGFRASGVFLPCRPVCFCTHLEASRVQWM